MNVRLCCFAVYKLISQHYAELWAYHAGVEAHSRFYPCQSTLRHHVCVLLPNVFYMVLYNGASGTRVPKNGATLVCSCFGEISVPMYDPHIA